VGVRVDKAGRDDAVACVDGLSGAAVEFADLGNFSVGDSNIGMPTLRTGAVDYEAGANPACEFCCLGLLGYAALTQPTTA
jgi:hypothetical protein